MRIPICRVVWSVALLLSTAAAAAAQVPGNYPAVAITAPGTACDDGPFLWGAPASAVQTGTYDVWLYPIVDGEPVDASYVGMIWPSGWTVTLTGVCAGVPELQQVGDTMQIGMVFGAGDPLEPARPALRFTVEAPTPGILDLSADLGPYGQIRSGAWEDGIEFGDGIGWVTVGDVHCERHPLDSAGDFCSLVGGVDPGEATLPATVSLDTGTVHTETFVASTRTCTVLPECGIVYDPLPCIASFSSSLPWVSASPIDAPDDAFEGLLAVDATGIDPGAYTAHLEYGGVCGNCGLRCHDLEILVGAVPVERVTWGRVKASYRD